MISLNEITVVSSHCSHGRFELRTDVAAICVSSGDGDGIASAISCSDVSPVAKMLAHDIVREAQKAGVPSDDVGSTSDGGLVLDFAGSADRTLTAMISSDGGWTYFSAAIADQQVAAGVVQPAGVGAVMEWAAGRRDDLRGTGVTLG